MTPYSVDMLISKENGLKYSSVNRGFPAGNPIANVFVIIVGALAISASIVLGFLRVHNCRQHRADYGLHNRFESLVVQAKEWVARRRQPPRPRKRFAEGGVIEGEFRVVADDREDE